MTSSPLDHEGDIEAEEESQWQCAPGFQPGNNLRVCQQSQQWFISMSAGVSSVSAMCQQCVSSVSAVCQ